jgi:hypothetical protein
LRCQSRKPSHADWTLPELTSRIEHNEDAIVGYFDELAQVREMLDSRASG